MCQESLDFRAYSFQIRGVPISRAKLLVGLTALEFGSYTFALTRFSKAALEFYESPFGHFNLDSNMHFGRVAFPCGPETLQV